MPELPPVTTARRSGRPKIWSRYDMPEP
jgi:hypothetical protein